MNKSACVSARLQWLCVQRHWKHGEAYWSGNYWGKHLRISTTKFNVYLTLVSLASMKIGQSSHCLYVCLSSCQKNHYTLNGILSYY